MQKAKQRGRCKRQTSEEERSGAATSVSYFYLLSFNSDIIRPYRRSVKQHTLRCILWPPQKKFADRLIEADRSQAVSNAAGAGQGI